MRASEFDRRIRRAYERRFGRSPETGAPATPSADPAERRREIAELAEAVSEEHAPRGPVDPAAIAAAKSVTVSFGRYGEAFDGMLECRRGRFHVYANLDRLASPDAPRCRFTLAHELGHLYIDEHREALAAGRAPTHRSATEHESPRAVEQEADLFAAHLLMPPRRFLHRVKSLPPGLAGVLEAAETFGVSVTAAAVQVASLDASPCAVVKWDRRGFAWKSLSSRVFQAYFRRTFESPDDLPPDSPTRRALAQDVAAEVGTTPARPRPPASFYQAGTTAAAWFPSVESGGWRDVLFIEQAVPLGRFGALTFLYPEGGRLPTTSGRTTARP